MTAGGLEFDGLHKRFGSVVALDGLTFTVHEGEVFGFVGSNGAGKTTAMRIALGVLSADAGEVRWRGQEMTLASRRQVGYMPEERGLYPRMKVGEQVEYLARLHGMPVADARRAVDVWLRRLGVVRRRGDEVLTLSLGNQQRVQLAAALVHDPAVLVLDEPFSGLDPVAVEVMSGVLRTQADRGVPVVFSSHQLDLVERLCDRVGIIKEGRMVASGTVAELASLEAPRLVVDGPAGAGWAAGLPGVQVMTADGSRTTLRLAAGADDQAVLRAALAAGPVHTFGHARVSLSEVFRDVVTVETDEEPA